MLVQGHDLWSLVKGRPQIDPDDLAAAIADQIQEVALDYRTRLLIHDGAEALRHYWGAARFEHWLAGCMERERLEKVFREDFERPGFPSIRRRLMEKTDAEDVRQYFRKLGLQLHRPVRVNVGGSVALILKGFLSRQTEDIDVVDEVPAEIRSQHRLLDELEADFGLHLAHFQSHYLPRGWDRRVHSMEPFGQLQVYLVDVYDVFLSKLFSARSKDQDDLRMLIPQLDKEVLVQKLKDTTVSWQAAPDLLKHAQTNWYILYGEALPL
jgi:Nucleotidyltransferase of unknown function (DUF6036)